MMDHDYVSSARELMNEPRAVEERARPGGSKTRGAPVLEEVLPKHPSVARPPSSHSFLASIILLAGEGRAERKGKEQIHTPGGYSSFCRESRRRERSRDTVGTRAACTDRRRPNLLLPRSAISA